MFYNYYRNIEININIRQKQIKTLATVVSKNSMPFFVEQNNVPMIGKLKVSMMGFVPKLLSMYFFETP